MRNAITLATLAAGLLAQPAAAAGLDLCNDVLQQDIFNRTAGNAQASQSERQAFLDSFYSQDATTAYEEYKQARTEQHNAATSVKAEGQYGIIRGEFDLSTEHGAAMSLEDFSKQFNDKKSQQQHQSSGSSSRDSSLISTYQTTIRDPNTIEAWRQCMQSRTSDPSLVAYGYRDAGGNPYLTAMWLPGRALASIAPEVEIRFVSPDPDITVEGAEGAVTLASGSGTAFVLRFKTPDSPARFQGFAVLVNAAARDGTRHLMDFHETATVPPIAGEVPCDLLIQPGREYGLAITLPNFMPPNLATSPANTMVLRVGGAPAGSDPAAHEFDGQVTFTPEAAQQMLANSHANRRIVQLVSRPLKAWVRTEGTALQFRMEQKFLEPGVLGAPGQARCTIDRAEGSLPSDQVAVEFAIVAKR